MSRAIFTVLALIAGGLLITTLTLVFLAAPVEANMGIVQKIFYFHVPAAYSMYLSWGVCTLASVIYLIKRSDRFDCLAKSAAKELCTPAANPCRALRR